MDKSVLLQKNIKDNVQEQQDYLRDLNNWEQYIKEEDRKLSNKAANEQHSDGNLEHSRTTQPVRSKKTVKLVEQKESQHSVTSKKNQGIQKRISGFDYAAWDKFDVEKALDSTESDSETEENVANTMDPVRSSEVLPDSPVRSSQSPSTNPTSRNQLPAEKPSNTVDDKKRDRANKLKEEGNKCYTAGRLEDAVAKYTQGMALDPTNELLPANRAMAYIKLKKFEAAEADCSRCLKLDSTYIKGYLRRATARTHLNLLDGAIGDYRKVLELEPWNKDAKRDLEALSSRCKKEHESRSEIDKKEDEVHKEEVGTSQQYQDVTSENDPKFIKAAQSSVDTAKAHGKNSNSSTEERRGKKVKITEVNSPEGSAEVDPCIVQPVDKPIHLRSKKPLIKVPVQDVATKEDIFQVPSVHKKPVLELKAEQTAIIEVQKPEAVSGVKRHAISEQPKMPAVPKTSHQFMQDWRKISSYSDLASQYILSIPPQFFQRAELETDLMVEIIGVLKHPDISASVAAEYVTALSKSQGFYISMTFLELPQKKVFHDVIEKITSELQNSSDIQRVQNLLN